MRLPAVAFAACLLLAACAPDTVRTPPTPEETRLLAFLARDGYVVIEDSARDANGHLLVVTRQGNRRQRYLIAPDDPARPQLRLRRLEDECTLATVPNPHPGRNPISR